MSEASDERLIEQAKAYAHCACPEDEKTGRVTYHLNCARRLMPILEEIETRWNRSKDKTESEP